MLSDVKWFWLISCLVILVNVSVLLISPNTYQIIFIRYIFGLLFVFTLPGYSLTRALFPVGAQESNSSISIDPLERAALSVGLSIAISALTGMMLNYTPWGIQLSPILVALSAITIIFAVIAIIRENQMEKISLNRVKLNE